MKIEIDGIKFAVIEHLGFQHSVGAYAVKVETEHGAKMAVKFRGSKKWRFWTVKDRLGIQEEKA
jgi:hypothetical protein